MGYYNGAEDYYTHIIGRQFLANFVNFISINRWHLGFCNWKYTPTYRGFDSFLGYYVGAEDYYTHIRGREFLTEAFCQLNFYQQVASRIL